MFNLLNKFKLGSEKENMETVITNVSSGVVFRGTNLWILIFAIFIASLGLNINSTAVIIGAMLISPLMGPIMGVGLSMGINDLHLLRRSISNYLIATVAALTTSTLFFLISPLNDAHSEILARTSPTIYDVLIALFGGFAGIMATSSKYKGNVIPGVAIATALMPPLCTAGYGIATFQLRFFFGAFYLYIINTVFIALATLLIVRLLHIPHKHLQTKRQEIVAQRVIWLVVLITILPSIYLGYDLVERNRFIKKANLFITNEAHFPNDYLLSKLIEPNKKKITLVFGGQELEPAQIAALKTEMPNYGLDSSYLAVRQGFSYLSEKTPITENEKYDQLTAALTEQENVNLKLRKQLDSVKNIHLLSRQIYSELKASYPEIQRAIVQPSNILTDSSSFSTYLVLISARKDLKTTDKNKLGKWLKARLNKNEIELVFQ